MLNQRRLAQMVCPLSEELLIFQATHVSDAVSAGMRQLNDDRSWLLSGCCHTHIDSRRRHHCRLIAYASVLLSNCKSFFFRLPVRGAKSWNKSNVLRVEAARLDIRYTAHIGNAPLSDLSHPKVVPQTWARRRQTPLLAVSIMLSFFLISPSRTVRIAPVGSQLLYAMLFDRVDEAARSCCRRCVILLKSIRNSRANARFSPQVHHLSGRYRLGCWPCASRRRCRRFKSWTACLQGGLPVLCSLRFGLVSSIFGGLKYVLPQRTLVLPAMGVPYSSSSSVRDTDYFRETQNSDPGARGGQCLLCPPRVLHLGSQHACRSLGGRRRRRSAGTGPDGKCIVCLCIYLPAKFSALPRRTAPRSSPQR
jgi:hypothetical protein